jgi:methylphosphotriester-DNA--protein-cysteine methyltransferase
MARGSDIERWTARPPARREPKWLRQLNQEIGADTRTVERQLQAIAEANEYGMMQAVSIKRFQRQCENMEPDATEALAFIANNAMLTIAQRLQRFGSEV